MGSEEERKKRKHHYMFVQDKIIAVKAASKRKAASITFEIPDDIAQKIMQQKVLGKTGKDGYPLIMALALDFKENLS